MFNIITLGILYIYTGLLDFIGIGITSVGRVVLKVAEWIRKEIERIDEILDDIESDIFHG